MNTNTKTSDFHSTMRVCTMECTCTVLEAKQKCTCTCTLLQAKQKLVKHFGQSLVRISYCTCTYVKKTTEKLKVSYSFTDLNAESFFTVLWLSQFVHMDRLTGNRNLSLRH